jgi:lipopolysaccharide exporter
MSASLSVRSFRALKWSVTGTGVTVLLQLTLVVVMARLLPPAAVGQVAIAQVVMRFLAYFSQAGVGPALVQKPRIDDDDVRAAVTLTVIASSSLYGVLWLCAPAVAQLFRVPAVEGLLRIMGVGLIVNALANVSIFLLRRQLKFGALAMVEVLSYALGYGVVGVSCALAGLGVWSLAASTLTQSALALVIAYWKTRHPLLPRWHGASTRRLAGFGSQYSLANFLDYLCANLDVMVIGRTLGDFALGHYNRAMMITTLPAQQLVWIASKVLFPALSELQHDRPKVGKAFQAMAFLVVAIVGSISVGMAIASEELVAVMLGAQWLDAAPLVVILAGAAPFVYFSHISGVVLDSQALLRPKIAIQLSALTLLGVLLALFVGRGAEGIAIAVLTAEATKCLLYGYLVSGILSLRNRESVRLLLRGIATAAAVGAAIYAGRWLVGQTGSGTSSLGTLLLEIALGILTLGAALAWSLARLSLLREFRARLFGLTTVLPHPAPEERA